jgi:hypothetical protein
VSDTAHINLLELEDSVKGRVEGLEGRFGRGPVSRPLGAIGVPTDMPLSENAG